MTVDDLLKKWLGKTGGAERANDIMSLSDLCRTLDLPEPEPARRRTEDFNSSRLKF